MKKKMKKTLALALALGVMTISGGHFVYGEESPVIENVEDAFQDAKAPAFFSWSGGTGKVEITCNKIMEKDGITYGEIVFSSDAYTYVKTGGETYYPVTNDQGSVFEIPIELNKNTEIQAMTTRMSEAHEITYMLYAGEDYRDDSSIIEIKNQEKEEKVFFVPEDMEVPAGAEKEMTVVKLPVNNVFYGTEEEIDYKKLVEDKCGLAVITTGTLSEEVFEKLELLGIPVICEYSSEEELPSIEGAVCISQMELEFAQGFDVYNYVRIGTQVEEFSLIDVHDVARYLVVEEGTALPENLEEDIVVLQKPLDHIYLAATSVMSLFDSLDSLENIRLSGADVSGWYIENAVKAMENGEILYAGKYSEPDYELLLSEGCDLAIESTMIQHTPKVKEMIEDLGIPVFIDYSSYESHPLGRTEWIKLYSVLTEKEEEGKEFFATQSEIISRMNEVENTGKTVAFFYVSTDGKVVVRSSEDYIPKMIEIAGGKYIFEDLKSTEGKQSSVSMTMEEFYNTAVNADYLIYNASIDSPVETIEELLTKSELFADFKAVKEGNVWGTGKYLYQATDIVGNMIEDIHLMLTEDDKSNKENMTFIFPIE